MRAPFSCQSLQPSRMCGDSPLVVPSPAQSVPPPASWARSLDGVSLLLCDAVAGCYSMQSPRRSCTQCIGRMTSQVVSGKARRIMHRSNFFSKRGAKRMALLQSDVGLPNTQFLFRWLHLETNSESYLCAIRDDLRCMFWCTCTRPV